MPQVKCCRWMCSNCKPSPVSFWSLPASVGPNPRALEVSYLSRSPFQTRSGFHCVLVHPGALLWLEQAKWVAQRVGQRKPYPSCRTQAPLRPSQRVKGSVEEAVRVCIRGTMRCGEWMTPGDRLHTWVHGACVPPPYLSGCLWGPAAPFSRCLHTASWQQACSSAN